jgi:hypothetical protein
MMLESDIIWGLGFRVQGLGLGLTTRKLDRFAVRGIIIIIYPWPTLPTHTLRHHAYTQGAYCTHHV